MKKRIVLLIISILLCSVVYAGDGSYEGEDPNDSMTDQQLEEIVQTGNDEQSSTANDILEGRHRHNPTDADFEPSLEDITDDVDDVEDDDGEVSEPDEPGTDADDATTETQTDEATVAATEAENAGIQQENVAEKAETADEANAPLGGDPVRLSEGSYVQNEKDFVLDNMFDFSVNRQYVSNNAITSSFGYAWVTNLDERIVLGVDAGCENNYKASKAYYDNLKERISTLEQTLAEKYHVTDIYNAAPVINERINKCESNLNKLQNLKINATELYSLANSYHLSIAERILAEKERINSLISHIENKKEKLRNSLNRLNYEITVLNNLKTKLISADKELKEKQTVLEKARNIKSKNSFVRFPGMEQFYEETGFNTLTVIDENGTPHLLYETKAGVWTDTEDKTIKQCEKAGEGYKVVLFDGSVKNYDSAGFIVRITDRNGNYINIKRDTNEKLLCIESNTGEKLKVDYEGNYISKITNVRSSEENVEYKYEGNKLKKVKDTDGDVVSMGYDSNGRMSVLSKCDDSFVKFNYAEQTADGKVLATSTVNEEGYKETFQYDKSGKKTVYTDHDGNKTTYFYDSKHRTEREVRPDGTVIINRYDTDGNLSSVNENGNVTTYSYDERGNRTGAVYSDGSSENWSYDRFNQIESYKDRDGVYTQYVRDDKGNLREYYRNGTKVYSQQVNSRGQVTKLIVYGQKNIITDYEYDGFGNLRSEICGGVKTEYKYDSRNRLTEVLINSKTVTSNVYDGHKTIKKSYNGLETIYETNGRKDLVKVTQKDVITGEIHQTRIEYDKRHLPLRVYIGNGKTEVLTNSYLYTKEGKVSAEVSHGKESWIKLYEYRNGQISEIKQFKVTEPAEITEDMQLALLLQKTGENIFIQKYKKQLLNNNRSLLTITNGLGDATLFEYDSFGNLVKATDGNGEVRENKFTKAGRVSRSQTSYGGWYEYGYTDGINTGICEENGNPVETRYNSDGSIMSVTDRYGMITNYNYDNRGRVSSIQSDSTKIWYEYDVYDRVIKQVVGNGADEGSSIYYITYDYSADGRKTIVCEGGKYRTEQVIDAFGNVIKQTDGNNNERSYVYNERNKLIESEDGYGNKTIYEYNALGYVESVTVPDGAKTEYKYSYMGLLENVTDDCGTVYTAAYDKAGRLKKERSRADVEKSYEYDKGGRITKVMCGGEVVESYVYGARGRTVTVKDGKGNDYLYNYDAFGRLINEKNRLGYEQNYLYDEAGLLKNQNNFDGSITTVNYSNARTVRIVKYSDGTENRFVYDALGNITEAQNAYGKTVYSYDQGARLIYQKDVTTGEEVYFEYDDAGNRTKLLSTNRSTSYTYGKNNEITEIFDNKQRISIKLEYDKNGKEILRRFGNGTAEVTHYDKVGRVTVKMQKSDRNELLWGEGYAYGEDGKRIATVDNTGRVTLYEYNKKGQLETVYYPYTQELINNLKTEAEENGLAAVAEVGENRYLTYTEKASLVSLLNSMQYGLSYNLTNLQLFIKESYTYDRNGNRSTKTTGFGTISYIYDNENRLLSSGSKGQKFVNYTYDKMGNLLTEESAVKVTKYAYNSQNRLIYCEVTDNTNKEYAQTSYAYDAFGRRIIVQDKGEAALRTLYDGLTFNVIKQSPTYANGLFTDSSETGIRWGATGRPTGDRYRYLGDEDTKDGNRYFYLNENTYRKSNNRYRGERTQINVNGILAAQATSDFGTEYFTTDLLGSIRTTTDIYGSAKSKVSYDAFGSLVEGSLTGTADFGYLGKQNDTTTNLYNYGYRDYKPTDARFTTVDPIRDGFNWFSYCNGDPLNFVDLWGLNAEEVKESTLFSKLLSSVDNVATAISTYLIEKGHIYKGVVNTVNEHGFNEHVQTIMDYDSLEKGGKYGTVSVVVLGVNLVKGIIDAGKEAQEDGKSFEKAVVKNTVTTIASYGATTVGTKYGAQLGAAAGEAIAGPTGAVVLAAAGGVLIGATAGVVTEELCDYLFEDVLGW